MINNTGMNVILITGGARSGKSSHALELADAVGKKVFIATAMPLDDEMRDRIAKHQEDRDPSFITIEAPVSLAKGIACIPTGTKVAVIDCLSVWIGNLMHSHGEDADSYPEIDDFLAAIKTASCDLVIVSGEVGMGIVPDNAMARKFRDIAGRVNQQVAKLANTVILTVSGIPIKIK